MELWSLENSHSSSDWRWGARGALSWCSLTVLMKAWDKNVYPLLGKKEQPEYINGVVFDLIAIIGSLWLP